MHDAASTMQYAPYGNVSPFANQGPCHKRHHHHHHRRGGNCSGNMIGGGESFNQTTRFDGPNGSFSDTVNERVGPGGQRFRDEKIQRTGPNGERFSEEVVQGNGPNGQFYEDKRSYNRGNRVPGGCSCGCPPGGCRCCG